jgi:Cdc6-like AAA superfamily ATPase
LFFARVAELDMYSLLRTRILSRGRYGRTREIMLDLPEDIVEKIYATIKLNMEIDI